ncbi:MAG: two-component system, chemotaxis family, protein-glutamate methylesterase/glutaminase [Campylobacterota bacterium]|nr:two-component system, chemotaxis family, protein-glutamate methylesterase/glutaminase [Campylobacterota bacterium]
MENFPLIFIGASTGGPSRIHTIVSSLSHDFRGAIIIAQHMGAEFISSFIKQLQKITSLNIEEIKRGVAVALGTIYVCEVTSRLVIKEGRLWLEPALGVEHFYSPEVNTLFHSASLIDRSIERIGIILTGIGDDGALGALALSQSGAQCYFESEESATVFGMPRCAKELVPSGEVISMDDIVKVIQHVGAA